MPPSPCLQSRPADPPPPSYSVYSAHEHSALHASPSIHTSSLPSLPADIVAETLLSVLVVVTGIVLSSAPLKPIQWSVWAAEAEREEARRRIGKGRKVAPGETPGGNPFAWITEDRVGFWDGRVSCLLPLEYADMVLMAGDRARGRTLPTGSERVDRARVVLDSLR